ncbi:DUF2807 domain-containing protein [Vibrio porteresiae]|uniref:DUF2807 domain-containing protein n=1 Tax=Vibrio porteresiae DSM 19223 TaxID=1123496 RepID=A0ABZ0QHX1_9VIBR|nr:DUF2807 domain-containing protein [Vibrio porteresiae]WPC76045.1 DUF2807 domain-containing protein [Vibrio porteresiae DSM 19223]
MVAPWGNYEGIPQRLALANENLVEKKLPDCEYTRLTINVPSTVKLIAKGEFSSYVKGISKELNTLKYTCSNGEFEIDSESQVTLSKGFTFELSNDQISRLTLNGAQKVDVRELTAKSFTVILNGASNTVLQGQVGNLTVLLSGSAQLEATDLMSQNGKINIDGSGSVRLNVYSELNGFVNGSGRIEYLSSPKLLKQKIIGSGSISLARRE